MGESELIEAILAGDAERVRASLAAHPVLDVFEAAALGRTERVAELVRLDPSLVRAFSPDGCTPLHFAALFGHAETAELLIHRAAELDVPAANGTEATPLHGAAAGRHFEVAKLLVQSGADVDPTQAGGWTPLHCAAQNGDAAIVELLLDHGADPLAENDEGHTSLDVAKSAEVVALLEDRTIPEP